MAVYNKGSSAVPVARRTVLGFGILGVLGVLFGSKLSNRLNGLFSGLSPNNPLSNLLPGGAGFEIYTVAGFPVEKPVQYRLEVSGLVNTSLSLTYEDLLKLPVTHLTKDFQCVTGWRVPNVKWSGVRLSNVLELAGLKENAKAVLFKSFDGVYTESLTLNQAMRSDVIVAYSMLGGPITEEHGGPVRLYVAPMYGYKSIKWLASIEVAKAIVPGYWENLGYDQNAWIGRSNGRTDQPVD
jgi:DMSO/TMAO reductase YedYZ molybdopterin-dependent catalytic subunit